MARLTVGPREGFFTTETNGTGAAKAAGLRDGRLAEVERVDLTLGPLAGFFTTETRRIGVAGAGFVERDEARFAFKMRLVREAAPALRAFTSDASLRARC